jgi:hypothetical protein
MAKVTLEKDPDDKLYYVWDVTAILAYSNTTAVSVTPVAQGVTVLEGPALQGDTGGLIVAKVGGMGAAGTDSFLTCRVVCANTEQFDSTIYFTSADH